MIVVSNRAVSSYFAKWRNSDHHMFSRQQSFSIFYALSTTSPADKQAGGPKLDSVPAACIRSSLFRPATRSTVACVKPVTWLDWLPIFNVPAWRHRWSQRMSEREREGGGGGSGIGHVDF